MISIPEKVRKNPVPRLSCLSTGLLKNYSPLLIPFKTTAVRNTVTQMIEADTTIAVGIVIGNSSFK
ncbi:hypothetical protein ACIQZD_21195 [Peribacillus sp. NPDC096447]|uniref:hypothetical protein n=1 Tax=Peribacillus sp. NPDC096447 TaxID=3364394 RepID=UPI0037F4B1AD